MTNLIEATQGQGWWAKVLDLELEKECSKQVLPQVADDPAISCSIIFLGDPRHAPQCYLQYSLSLLIAVCCLGSSLVACRDHSVSLR